MAHPMLEIFIQQMVPTHSKPIPEQRPPGIHKCVLAASLASTDNVDVTAVKWHKLEEAIAAQHHQHQPSVQDIDDNDNNDDLTLKILIFNHEMDLVSLRQLMGVMMFNLMLRWVVVALMMKSCLVWNRFPPVTQKRMRMSQRWRD